MNTLIKFKDICKMSSLSNIKIITIVILFLILFSFNFQNLHAQTNISSEKIDKYIQSKMKKSSIPGLAVAITHKDKVLFSKGYGESGNNIPVTADTQFAIASLSKSFTAMAVMNLVEENLVNLDTPIMDYIPSFELRDSRGSEVTVRYLLNQTGGLADTIYPEMKFKSQPLLLEDIITQYKNVKLVSNPGEKFHYHNPNYEILARLVEVVSHENFADYLKNHILKPLEMDNTFNVSNTNQFYKSADNLSDGHILLFGRPITINEPDWFVDGAAGMVSTVNDMAHWLILQLNAGKYKDTQLLSSDGIKTMHSSPLESDSHYGMGWTVNEPGKISHNGILWTFTSEQVLLPDQGYGIVVLFNSGINAFVDYSSFTQGITELLNNREPTQPMLSNQFIEACIAFLIIMTVIIGIRKFFLLRKWVEKYKDRLKWRLILDFMLTLIPFILFVSLPQIMTFIGGGRVLSWERIFLTMPSIFIWLALTSMLSLTIVTVRIIHIIKVNTIKHHRKIM